uniref:Uncharacterized protein n=1 Tax=Pristionchus pacificus TaxID=54126 RepID=A0A8R1YK11_PRIPA
MSDSKRSEIIKKKGGKEEVSLGPPSDKEMKSLKRKSELMEAKKENEEEKEDKEKKEEKDTKESPLVVDGIQTTENSPRSEEKTKEVQSGQELVPGESRQSVTGIKGQEFRNISYTTIIIVFIELVLCLSAFIYVLQERMFLLPKIIICINLGIVFLSSVSLLIVLFARFHVSLFETDSQLKYAVTCARRFLLFSSHSIRFFLSLCTLIFSILLPEGALIGISTVLVCLSLIHVIFSLKMQPVIPSPC